MQTSPVALPPSKLVAKEAFSPPYQTPKFGAYYQCHKNPYATYKCIESFRKFYPDASIVLVSDNGYDYTEMAKWFHCEYIHYNENMWLIWEYNNDVVNLAPGNIYEMLRKKYVEPIHWVNKLFERFSEGFSKIKEEYFIWLEDDVVINNIVNDPLLCDINGYNPNSYHISMKIPLSKTYTNIDINKKYTWSGGGGSIFHKTNILKYMKNREVIDEIVNNWAQYNFCTNIVCDILLSTITHINGGTVGACNGISDGPCDYPHPNISVQHQYKKYYGVQLPDELKQLVMLDWQGTEASSLLTSKVALLPEEFDELMHST